jgi:MFS family permease
MTDSPVRRWLILLLAALTGAVVIGVPAVSLAVLFKEISGDLHLTLVQIGWIWSIGSLPAMITSPLSGALSDRFGPKRVMIAGILLVSLTAGMRGLAQNFTALLLIIVAVGATVPLVMSSAYKISGILFPPRRLGLANGVLSMGMALGALLGALLSATLLSPALGGWRHVLFFYAAVAILLAVPWGFLRIEPPSPTADAAGGASIPVRRALGRVVTIGNIWLLGIAYLGIAGCTQGVSGYLPTYLRASGWNGASADRALSFLNAISMIFILPVMFWTDRLKNKRLVLMAMICVIAAGTALLGIAGGWATWAELAMIGVVGSGSTALLITIVIESQGVGPVLAGTATGFVMFFFYVGNLLAPPIGNRLAEISSSMPFLFWGGLAAFGIISLLFIKSPATRHAPPGMGNPEAMETP